MLKYNDGRGIVIISITNIISYFQKIRNVWFNIHLHQSEWITVLAEQFGFEVHHAKPPSLIVMMKWLSETETNQVELKVKQ